MYTYLTSKEWTRGAVVKRAAAAEAVDVEVVDEAGTVVTTETVAPSV